MEGITNWWADFAETFEKCFIKDDRYMLLLDENRTRHESERGWY